MISLMTIPLPLQNLKPADLPMPPESALRMLQACSAEDVDQNVLTQFAESDPVLTAEILRVVNTPLFGIGKEVMSVRNAIALLGNRALQSVVLCLMVREVVQGHPITGLNLTEFWEDTVRRAISARVLASHARLNGDECFTLGMMQDFGVLILFYLNPDIANEYSNIRLLDPNSRLARERELFSATHTQIMAVLAQSWSLPKDLVDAVTLHHGPNKTPQAALLYCCDWVNAVFTATDISTIFNSTRQLLQEQFALSLEEVQDLFAQLPEKVELSARAMDLHVASQPDFEGLLRQANLRLSEDNTAYQELTWQLEKAIAERDRLTQELNNEIALAREIQRKLMPEPANHDLPIFGINRPARNISGDFYDFLVHKDGNIWFVLGDVAGKGVNAGMLMAKTAGLFRCLVKHISDPLQLIRIINEELCETSTRGYFITMVMGVYTPAEQTVRMVNAGHLPVLIMGRDCQPSFVSARDPPVGIIPDVVYSLSEAISLQNKCLYLYSDGVTESKRSDDRMLEINGLVTLIQARTSLPPRQRLESLVDAVVDDKPLLDDVTLLMLEPQ